MSPSRMGIVLGFSLVALGAGCFGRGSEPAPTPSESVGPGGRHGPPQVIRTVRTEVEVDRVGRAVRELRRTVTAEGGWIATAIVHHEDGGDASGVVEARVPAA